MNDDELNRDDEEFAHCRNVPILTEEDARTVLSRCLMQREVERAVELNGKPFPICWTLSTEQLEDRRRRHFEYLANGLLSPFSKAHADLLFRNWLFSDPKLEAEKAFQAAYKAGELAAKHQNAKVYSAIIGSGDKSFGMTELVER